MVEDRLESFTKYATEHFVDQIGVNVAFYEPYEWAELSEDIEYLGPTANCGWGWPQIEKVGGEARPRITIPFCVPVLLDATSFLEHLDFEGYVTAIFFVLDSHIAYRDRKERWDLHKSILDEIKDKHPGVNEMMEAVQLGAYE